MIHKILVFGSQGMLGSYLVRHLSEKYQIIPISRKEYDVHINSWGDLDRLLKKHQVDHDTLVINAIGIIPQANKNYPLNDKLYIRVNSIFPHILANFAEKYHAHMIHSSTDCVYTGRQGKYLETDPHDETTIYGVTKSEGEPENCTVIRTSIIGEEKRNFRSLLEWVKSNKGGEINGFTNHLWNGITCLEYAHLIDYIIQNNLFWKGNRHILSPNDVSKYELVSYINDIYQLGITITPIESGQQCDKTLRSIHDPIYNIPDLKDQVMELYMELI